jgi:SAM-dependent methyltransferase
MLEILNAQMDKRGMADRVKPILGSLTDCKIPRETCDLIILVDVYHEMDHPYEMTRSMVDALKPGGRLVLVEYRLEDPTVPIKRLHKMSEAQVKKEMAVHPRLTFVENIDRLPRQHVLVFRKTNAGGRGSSPLPHGL